MTLQEALKDSNGKVIHVFKHMPLTQIHPWAMKAAMATEALYQLKPEWFWELHDYLFKSQKELTASNFDEKVESFLTSKKVSLEDYKRKLAAPEVQQAVDKDVKEASLVGVQGTPTFFVNGRFMNEGLSATDFKKAFDEALSDLGPTK